MTIGLCGLGQMGLAVAERLATAFDVTAFDPSEDRRALAAAIDRVTPVDSLEPLRGLDLVVLSLPKPAISLSTCEQLTELLAPGALVVETSTLTPDDVHACVRVLDNSGLRHIDAAILSGVQQMSQGAATLLVGGEDDDLTSAASVLDVLGGAHVERFGGHGTGMAAKVVNNAVAHAVMVVLSEAAAMTVAQGIDLHQVAQMLAAPDGGLIRPLTYRVMERVARAEYEGGMPLDAARKDSILAMDMAESSGVPLFAIRAAHTVYDLGLAAGLARKDYAAIATLWESWTDSSLAIDADGTGAEA